MVKGITVAEPEGGVYNLGANAKFGDIAYIPGSGPKGSSCDTCFFMVHSRGAKIYGRCEMAARLRHVDIRDLGYVDRTTIGCKYYEARSKELRPWHRYEALLKD